MKRSWTITMLKHKQPSEQVWNEIGRLVSAWNQREAPQWGGVVDFMWLINFDEATQAEMNRLINDLEDLKLRSGAAYYVSWRDVLEEQDYAAADFIEILGVDLEDTSEPFVLNEEAAIGPGQPCPVCGWHDIFDSVQLEPFKIDETQLNHRVADESPSGDAGWDLVNLPNGRKLVSRRLASTLEENNVKGYDLSEVIDGATGRVSTRMFQLTARQAILTPCMEHTRVSGEPFCPACGTAYGDLEGYFWARDDWIGEDEVISHHPQRSAMLYVSRRVYQLLLAAGLSGIHRNNVLFVCHHD